MKYNNWIYLPMRNKIRTRVKFQRDGTAIVQKMKRDMFSPLLGWRNCIDGEAVKAAKLGKC